MTRLSMYKKLAAMRKAAGEFRPSSIEDHFLELSKYVPDKALRTKPLNLYDIRGEEIDHIADAFEHFGKDTSVNPTRIDRSGSYDFQDHDILMFLSPRQFDSGHYSKLTMYLEPLIEKIQTEGKKLIEDFWIHEAVVGNIIASRGGAILEDVQSMREKFRSGPYTIATRLDTPNESIRKLKDLRKDLNLSRRNPARLLRDRTRLEDLTNSALELREQIGTLSRFDIPKKQVFAIESNYYVKRTSDSTEFFLYNPNTDSNVLVYFGKNPFEGFDSPYELEVLKGKDHEDTLSELLRLGFYTPSEKVIEERLRALKHIEGKMSQSNNEEALGGIRELVRGLENAQKYFARVPNNKERVKYCLNHAEEFLDFMVYPTDDDPTLHELLPRLSWNKNLRDYSNTRKFIHKFEEGDEQTKRDLIGGVTSNIFFSNHQNVDVNNWLFENYRDLCEDEGVRFNEHRF